jgi:long-chain acyl-CoA synthetase
MGGMGEAELPADLDTFPKLLARNARELGTLPAYREKEFGIWQSWTWAEAEAEIFALAAGLAEIGLQPGDHLAIIGRNRPYLYWAMVAAQACGAIPVPLYQDAVAEEMAYVLQHCGATVAVAADQEQVDKLLEAHEQAPDLRDIVYLDPRGLRRYDHSRLHAYTDVQARGRQADASVHAAIRERTGAQGADDTCVISSSPWARPAGAASA